LPSQSCLCQEFVEIANAPPSSSSRRLRHKIKGNCWRANIVVSPLLLRRFLHSLVVAVSPPSRFKENERCGRSRQQPIQQTDFRYEQEGGWQTRN
jgi:hypothetical protein